PRFGPCADGFLASSLAASSGGTGALSGSASAPASTPPVPRLSLKTIVWSSGVSIPLIGLPGFERRVPPPQPADLRARLGAALRALEVAEVGARVAVLHGVEEAALDRVLDVLGRHLA